MHLPAKHFLPPPQSLPASTLANVQPSVLWQLSVVQTLLSLQMTGWPLHPWVPASQVSLVVHALPSSQAALPGRCPHPNGSSQASAVHGAPSSQPCSRPTHPPFWQASLKVQVLPSSQALPSWTATSKHLPCSGLHKFWRQNVSLTVWHVTTVCGLS